TLSWSVIHRHEEQPAGWRRAPGLRSVATGKHAGNVVARPAGMADLDERAGDGPDHVPKETLAPHFEGQEPSAGRVPSGPPRRSDGAHRGVPRAPGSLKGSEIVLARERLRGRPHQFERQWLRHVPHELTDERRYRVAVPDPILVGLRPCAEARVKVVRHC